MQTPDERQLPAEGKIEFANALRGIAALSVMIGHYFVIFWLHRGIAGKLANVDIPPPETVPTPDFVYWVLPDKFSLGLFGVALFFLISGFVIPFSFKRTTALPFLVGRIFRIYPVYIAGFSITVFSLWFSGILGEKPFPFSLREVLIHAIPGLRDLLWSPSIDGIIWTLEIELKFYLVCALAATLLRRASLWTFAIPVLLLVIVNSFHGAPWGTLARTLAHNAEYMIFMFVGVALNFYFRNAIRLPALILITGSILALFWRGMSLSGEPATTMLSFGVAFLVFASAAGLSPWWPRLSVVSFFANISYPLYVIHGLTGYALIGHFIRLGMAPVSAMSLAAAIVIATAWVLHRLIEVPTHRAGQRLTKLSAPKDAPTPLSTRPQ